MAFAFARISSSFYWFTINDDCGDYTDSRVCDDQNEAV